MFIEQFLPVAVAIGTVLGAGLYIATSPCLFPLLPLYLINSLHSEQSRRKSLVVTSVLVTGVLTSLAVFIAVSSFIALLIIRYFTWIQAAVGAIITFLGVLTISHTLRDRLGITRLSLTSHSERPTGLMGVYAIGFGYSMLAAPCTAPSILALVFVFAAQSDPLVISIMFLALCFGVAVPYLAIALVTGEARSRLAARVASSARIVEIVVGLLLIALGVYLILPAFGVMTPV